MHYNKKYLILQVRKKVVSLMSIDLLRQQAKWKETLKEIRQIMTNVEQEGFTNLKVGVKGRKTNGKLHCTHIVH